MDKLNLYSSLIPYWEEIGVETNNVQESVKLETVTQNSHLCAGSGVYIHNNKILSTLHTTDYVVDNSIDSLCEYNTLEKAICDASSKHSDSNSDSKLAPSIILRKGFYNFSKKDLLKDKCPLNIHSTGDTTTANVVIEGDCESCGDKNFSGIIFKNGSYKLNDKHNNTTNVFNRCVIENKFLFKICGGTILFESCIFDISNFDDNIINILDSKSCVIFRNCTFTLKFKKCSSKKKNKSLIYVKQSSCQNIINSCVFNIKSTSDVGRNSKIILIKMCNETSLSMTNNNFNIDMLSGNLTIIGNIKHQKCVNLLITNNNFISDNWWSSNIIFISNIWATRVFNRTCVINISRCTFRGIKLFFFDGIGFNVTGWDQLILLVNSDGSLLSTSSTIDNNLIDITNVEGSLWILNIINSSFNVSDTTPINISNLKDFVLSLADTSFNNIPATTINDGNVVNIPSSTQPNNVNWLNVNKVDGKFELQANASVSLFNLASAIFKNSPNVLESVGNRLI